MRYDKSSQYSIVNGETRYFDELPTVHLYGMYDPADSAKPEFDCDRLTSTAGSSTSAIFYTAQDENFINYYMKPKYRLKKVTYSYNGSQYDFTEDNVQVWPQGDSSLQKPKKNLKLKFSVAHKIPGITKSKQYMLKADTSNSTHTQIGAWGNLWRQMMATREDYETLPESIKNSDCMGALRALPVKVYYTYANAEGDDITDYMGVYTMCEKKGDKLACFDAGSNPYGFLLSTVNCDGAGRGDLCDAAGLHGSARPAAFNKEWTGSDALFEHGFEFEDGDDDYVPEKVQFINSIIRTTMTATDQEFKMRLPELIDMTSFFDYIIFANVTTNSDSIKNIMYYTTDYRTDKLFPCAYDFDNCSVVYSAPWNNIGEVGACPYFQINSWNTDNDLISRIMNCFTEELVARYEYLRGNILTPENITALFVDEYSRSAMMHPYDYSTIDDSGNHVILPASAVAKKYDAPSSQFPPVPTTTASVFAKLSTRFAILDNIMQHLDDLYPYALINKLCATTHDVHSTGGSVNIFDYITMRPYIDGAYMDTVYAETEKHVLSDANGIIETVADDGTITFTDKYGYADIRLAMKQVRDNVAQGVARYGGYWGIIQSPTIRVYHDSGAATSVSLNIVNGLPYQFGKTVIIEATTDGTYDTISWSVTPDTANYHSDGTKLYITTEPFTEHYEVSCTCDSASNTLDFDTVSPSKLYCRYDNSILCNNIKNFTYDTTVIEGEFSLDTMGPDNAPSKIVQFLFDVSSLSVYPKKTTDKFDGVGLWYKYRRFKDSYYLSVMAFLGNNATAPLNSDCFSAGMYSTTTPAKYIMAHPTEIQVGKTVYFKLCKDYLQIDDAKFPFVITYAENKTTCTYPLRLWGEQKAGTGVKGNYFSKDSIYYLKVYENGVLTHHIKPNTLDNFQISKQYVIDAVDVSGTFTPITVPTTGTSSITDWTYNGYTSPSYAAFGVLEYLDDDDSDGGVPLSGSNFVDMGFRPTNKHTYKVVFKPEFDCDSTWKFDDIRGYICGITKDAHSTSRGTYDMAIGVYGGMFVTYHKGSIYKTTVPCTRGTIYRIELTAAALSVYNNTTDELLGTVSVPRTTEYHGRANLFVGSGSMMEGSCTYNANNNTAIPGFRGYVYEFSVFDETGSQVAHLVPNEYRTGFIDSGKEYLLYTTHSKHSLTPVPGIANKMVGAVSGTSFQFAVADTASNPVISTGAVNTYSGNEPTKYVCCGFNSMATTSEFLWKLEGDSVESFASIDRHTGLMTIHPSANAANVRVVQYWSVDPTVLDFVDVVVTYSETVATIN